MSNLPCSLTRNITSHSMKNLAFHHLLRWKWIILQYQFSLPYTFLFRKVGRMYFFNLGVNLNLTGRGRRGLSIIGGGGGGGRFININPFTSKSGQFYSFLLQPHQKYYTTLFIAYSDVRWLYYQISLPHLYIFLKRLRKCPFWTWEWKDIFYDLNVLPCPGREFLPYRVGSLEPFHSQVQKVHSPKLLDKYA